LKQAGVIGQDEFDKLKEDYAKATKEKDDYLNTRNEELKEKTEEKLREKKKDSVVEHKPRKIPATDKVVKKGPLKDGEKKKVSNAKKTTKSNKEDKSN
jgi:hypothetical protein